MKTLIKRTTAFLLCMLMAFGFSTFSFAAHDDPENPTDTESIVLEVGEPATVRYGQNVLIHAKASGVPAGYYLGVIVNDKVLFRGSDNISVDYLYLVDEFPTELHYTGDAIIDGDLVSRYLNLRIVRALVRRIFLDTSVKEDFEYTIAVVDKSGDLYHDANGQVFMQTNQVTVIKTLTDQVKHFFENLFFIHTPVDIGVK